MSSNDFALFALQITVMLGCAVLFGQVMRRMKQPAVLGEMIGGILLGPTILGALLPGVYDELFMSSADVVLARETFTKLGMLFFLFIAGLEVKLSNLRRLGHSVTVGLVGTLIPIGVGIAAVYLLPRTFWGVDRHFFAFALFVGMNFANSANPVIARILMDLGLLKQDFGTLIMTATIVDDLINWTLFAIILSQITPQQSSAESLGLHIMLVLLFMVAVLTIGHWLGPRLLPRIKRLSGWPTEFIAVTSLLILITASIAEKLGVHAFLGAFLAGAALGSNGEEKNEANEAITHFALSFFAPIYFVSMGLSTNFITHFDGVLVIVIVILACASKIGAVILAMVMAGQPINREAFAIGFGLNARGATGIILAGVGLEHGLLDDRLFVAMVVMALITSLLSGPLIKVLLAPALPQTVEQN